MPPTNELSLDAKTPTLEADALYGLPGQIIRKLAPQTESHPAAMLLDLLASLGSIIGHNAYYKIEGVRHYPNLFVVKVGRSSKGRKGTARARIAEITAEVDYAWSVANVVTGLSSSEGLIDQVRDEVRDDKDKVILQGIVDKRLHVQEGEFASVLVMLQRQGNTLSQTIRNAWDGQKLQTLVKHSPLEATGHHISVTGDITQEELQTVLAASERFNGFANRFLWALVERNGRKPFGGEELDWAAEIDALQTAITTAKTRQRMFFDRNAHEKWERVYDKLTEGNPGPFGAATSRGEAQVIRLALLYALLDCSEDIRVEHLNAALAVWRYCEESARRIFGGLTKRQTKIASGLQKYGALTATQVRERVFARNVRMTEILNDLAEMHALGVINFQRQNDGVERYEWVGDSRLI